MTMVTIMTMISQIILISPRFLMRPANARSRSIMRRGSRRRAAAPFAAVIFGAPLAAGASAAASPDRAKPSLTGCPTCRRPTRAGSIERDFSGTNTSIQVKKL